MKTLSETQILAGQTETISVMDLRKLPGEVFNQVEMGKVYEITRKGRPIAWICPKPPANRRPRRPPGPDNTSR